MTIQTILLTIIIGYVILLGAIGFVASKFTKNMEDFALAGRGLSAYVVAFTFSAAGMSGYLGLGMAGFVFTDGLRPLWTIVSSATVGVVTSFILVGKRARPFAAKYNAVTVPQLLEIRYEDQKKHLILLFSSIIITTSAISYVTSQSYGIAKIINQIMGWGHTPIIIVAGIIFIALTVLGGLLALSWTDVMQGCLMLTGSILAGYFGITFAGGFHNLSLEMVKVNAVDPSFIIDPFVSVPLVIYGVSLFLTDGFAAWLGVPSLISRCMASKNTRQLSLSALMAVFIHIILFGGVLFASLYMRTQFPTGQDLPFDPETVLIYFFQNFTNPVFAGLFVGSVVAAMISTADAMLLLGATTIVNDIVIMYFNKKLSEQSALNLIRVITVLIGIIGVSLAIEIARTGISVLALAWFGWTTLGIFCGPLTLGLWWKRATKEGAYTGLVLGFILLVVWQVFNLEASTNLFMAFPSYVASFLGTYFVSLFTQPVSEEMQSVVENLKHEMYVE